MRAVICRAWGAVEDLTVEYIAPPRPGPGEVLIAVKATAVNYADALLVAGATRRGRRCRSIQGWQQRVSSCNAGQG